MTSKVISLLTIFSMCAVAYSLRRDYPWTVKISEPMGAIDRYDGELELLFVFKDKTQHSIVLSNDPSLYNRKSIRLLSNGPIEALYMRTKGFCPLGLIPNKIMRIRDIELVSKTTNTAYVKQVNDLAIKDSCQANTQGTLVANFEQRIVLNCEVDGQVYEHGQDYEMGCVGRCSCNNGSTGCTTMCGARAWEEDQKCHFVRKPGQCCDDIICEEDPKTKICQEPKIGLLLTSDNKPVRRYPWSVLFCTNEKCSELHGGIIIDYKHILTYAPDLSYLKKLFVASGQYIVDQSNITEFKSMRVANVSAHPDFVNLDSPIADSASRLQVIEFEDFFFFDKFTQVVNLPFDEAHCLQLSKNDCPITTVGWDRTDYTDDEFRQWYLHADRAKRDPSLCQANVSKSGILPKILPKRRGDKRACVGDLVRTDCTGPLGGAVVAYAADYDFVVGLTDPDSALFVCDHAGTTDVLPLCKYLDWISSVSSPGFYI